MAVTITEITLLPVRRDKQVGSGTFTAGGGGGGSDFGTSQTFYDVTLSGFTDGTAALPSIFFSGDTNTGFFRVPNDNIGVAVGGSEKFRMASNGCFYATDDIVGFSTYISDKRLKDNVKPIVDGLSVIKKLNGISYTYKLDNSKHYGLIAQDVQKILPEIVKEHSLINDNNTQYKTLRYSEIIPYLIEAIKQQQKDIQTLRNEINYWRNSSI